MGFTIAKVSLANAAEPKRTRKVELLVDTGALYSVIPSRILKSLMITPKERRKFTLAGGVKIQREVGGAVYMFDGRSGFAPVIFGKPNDKVLLGVTALEAMGLELDPTTRKLKPAELYLL